MDAIRSAAYEMNGGAAPTGEGMDFMRNKIAGKSNNPASFSAQRGARTAANNIANKI